MHPKHGDFDKKNVGERFGGTKKTLLQEKYRLSIKL